MMIPRFNLRSLWVAPLLTILFASAGSLSASAEDIFGELTGKEGVKSTYLSGRLADKALQHLKTRQLKDFDLSDGFSSLYSYEYYNADATKKAKSILEEYVASHPDLELIIKRTDDFGEYLVYQKFNKSGDVLKMIVWNLRAGDFSDAVVIDWKEDRKK